MGTNDLTQQHRIELMQIQSSIYEMERRAIELRGIIAGLQAAEQRQQEAAQKQAEAQPDA